MRKITKLTAGSVVGVLLSVGAGGIAAAAPVTTTTSPTTTSPTTTSPTASSPSTSSPGTSSPTTTSPTTTSPGSSSPTAPAKDKAKALTGNEIWWIVHPDHGVNCAHAAKQLQRVRQADAAAAKRLGRWQTRQSAHQKSPGAHAATRNKVSSGKVKGFQKLEQDGQALIRRIETKCSVTSGGA